MLKKGEGVEMDKNMEVEKKDGYEKMDLSKFPEGPQEIIKYLDFLPDDEEERMNYLLGAYIPDVIVL